MHGERAADLTFISSACKCFASDVVMEVTTNAVQLLGGYGYVSDCPVERMMRDDKITQIYEGTNQIQRVVMARRGSPKLIGQVRRPHTTALAAHSVTVSTPPA